MSQNYSWARYADEIDKVMVTVHNDLIAFVEIRHDDWPENPCEWGTIGTIRSLSRKHINNIKSKEELDDLLESNPDAVALSYFEHGQCRWGVKGTMSSIPDFRWDGVEFAGIWIPDKEDVELADKKGLAIDSQERHEFFAKLAESACSIYTDWCNGDVFGYSIRIYKIRHHEDGPMLDDLNDYRYDKPVYEDSCYGYYGFEDVENAVKEALGITNQSDKKPE